MEAVLPCLGFDHVKRWLASVFTVEPIRYNGRKALLPEAFDFGRHNLWCDSVVRSKVTDSHKAPLYIGKTTLYLVGRADLQYDNVKKRTR